MAVIVSLQKQFLCLCDPYLSVLVGLIGDLLRRGDPWSLSFGRINLPWRLALLRRSVSGNWLVLTVGIPGVLFVHGLLLGGIRIVILTGVLPLTSIGILPLAGMLSLTSVGILPLAGMLSLTSVGVLSLAGMLSML